ncbi:hypothetical protein PG994_003554 [Apiospora phragmitis]|uniref:Uncharacterized protein n=1 Tax=Apiospora phragmitis TaxID=2905665 RepID=A0ABR1VZQ5_9PEZI
MRFEYASNDTPPMDTMDLEMFDTETIGECDKRCKKPCMNIATDRETYDMALESCDMLGLDYMGMPVLIALYPDMGVFLQHQVAPQKFHQLIEPSTCEMDLVEEAGVDMTTSVLLGPVAPDYFYPHAGLVFPPTQQGQDEGQDEEFHRPREPCAAIDYPPPVVLGDGPPAWYGEPFPVTEGTTMSQPNRTTRKRTWNGTTLRITAFRHKRETCPSALF